MNGNHPQKINVALYAYGHGVEKMPFTCSRIGAEKTVAIEYQGMKYVFIPAKARTVALSKTSHPKTTAPTAILSLPPGSGKNSLARPLAKWLGCTSIHDEWNPSMPVTEGWLHLTNCTAAECIDAGAKQPPPTIPATSSTADLLGELHARQDEAMRFILSAAEPGKQNKVFNELSALLAWTQTISNIHWRAIGVPNGPMLTSEPSTAAAASTAFKASTNLATGEPA